MYLATLDGATSIPSLSSSPWIRGAPQSGFSMLICRISARSSLSICGRPPTGRDKPAIQLDKEPTIVVRQPWPTAHLAPQNDQLMSKHRVLSFKPQLRLEWRGQNPQNET